jgi:dihydropteroate synthase
MQYCNINGIRIGKPKPVLMGVVNISPESFFQGSYVAPDQIVQAAEQMTDDGAEIIDIGARSTAPGSVQISVQEERDRVSSALESLNGMDLTISIDTMYPEVLNAASKYEIHAANDISGLVDQAMAFIIADNGLSATLMASNRIPGDNCSFQETISSLRAVMNRAEGAGIDNFVLDPGIGKWIPDRSPENDFEICRRFSELSAFSRPLLAAVSRKSFIGSVIGKEPNDRLSGTLGVTASLIMDGASLIRCHDVAETADVVKVLSSIRGW